ncbi:MAG TPA: mannitol dehydrogenase family protein [Geminicoccaceae bacterium]|nr:mannitol dehydrogenase family protein [Geminicoccaceae bacterium]
MRWPAETRVADMRLSRSSLADLPKGVAAPPYDRSRLKAGILHIGVGNFHRAHMARYANDLFAKGLDHDWAILGAGVRPGDAVMREKLEAQDWLTTAIELGSDRVRAEVVGSMVGFVPVEADNQALIRAMSEPAIRIVSLTVTEGGYYIDPAKQQFDAAHPDIRHDADNPDRPRTAFGAMVAALKSRRAAGLPPFTGLSCDNLPGNGDILRTTVVTLARQTDPDLAAWIDSEGAFPNSMVDSIVPATGPKELSLVRERFGIEDAAPVTHEPFRQWVIEDRFSAGRPRWEAVGVTFTDQVHDYERMKLRILNGGHATICYPAALLGIEIVSGTMADERIRRFFRKVEETEIVPHVAPVPDMTPPAYLDLIESRFANPAIVDTTRRLAFDGSNRQPKFILPSVVDGLAAGTPVEGLALVSAAWCRYCSGTTEAGEAIADNDPIWTDLKARALAARDRPEHWLAMCEIYGDLAEKPPFADAFARWLRLIQAEGVEAALTTYARA